METYKPILKPIAQELRANMTETERIIWSRICKKQIREIQFYRQKPIGSYIVDFYAPAVKLVLEIDGSQHFEIDHLEQDKYRDSFLKALGIYVLRFDNNQVRFHLNDVLQKIYQVVEDLVTR